MGGGWAVEMRRRRNWSDSNKLLPLFVAASFLLTVFMCRKRRTELWPSFPLVPHARTRRHQLQMKRWLLLPILPALDDSNKRRKAHTSGRLISHNTVGSRLIRCTPLPPLPPKKRSISTRPDRALVYVPRWPITCSFQTSSWRGVVHSKKSSYTQSSEKFRIIWKIPKFPKKSKKIRKIRKNSKKAPKFEINKKPETFRKNTINPKNTKKYEKIRKIRKNKKNSGKLRKTPKIRKIKKTRKIPKIPKNLKKIQ